jgi:hypothetical protein
MRHMIALLVPAAFAFDGSHALLQKVLDAHLSGGRVDYAAIKAAPADLDGYLAQVATAPVASMSPAEKKALYLDAYNAYTIDLVADAWPLRSIRDLDGGKVWDTRRFAVGGTPMTLNEIEGALRAMGDPRIHAALNCASLGCPPLSPRVFTATGLDAQLDAAAARFAATTSFSNGTLTVSEIFDWYAADFAAGFHAPDIPGLDGKAEAAANFVARYVPAEAAALHNGGYTVTFAPYDWSVNARANVTP